MDLDSTRSGRGSDPFLERSTTDAHPRGGRGSLMLVLGFAFAVEGALYSAVTPIVPLLTRRFSLSDSAAGLLLSGYSAGLVAGALLCVPLLKRVNARTVTIAGLVALALTTVLFAWGGAAVILIAARVGGGTAAGVMWTACITWLLSVWPDERRGAALGSSMSYAVVGTLAGPSIGTLAVQLGVRVPYTAVAILCVTAAAWILTMPRPPRAPSEPLEGALPATRARTLAVLAGGMLALAGGVIGLVNVAGPLVLTRGGASDLFGGLVFLGAAALTVLTGRPMGALVDRLGTRWPLLAGLLCLAILLILLGAGMSAPAVGSVVAALLVVNNLCYIASAAMLTGSGQAAGWSLRFATALVATVWGSGETVGALLTGLGLDTFGTAWTTGIGAALVVLGLAVLAVGTATRNPGRTVVPEVTASGGARRP